AGEELSGGGQLPGVAGVADDKGEPAGVVVGIGEPVVFDDAVGVDDVLDQVVLPVVVMDRGRAARVAREGDVGQAVAGIVVVGGRLTVGVRQRAQVALDVVGVRDGLVVVVGRQLQ